MKNPLINTTQYLIVIEIDRLGIITEYFSSLSDAQIFSKKTFSFFEGFHSNEIEKAIRVLKKQEYLSYRINGNQMYLGKTRYTLSNGEITISIIDVDKSVFCSKSFIKERENHSSVFNEIDMDENFLERFPNINIIAN